MYNPGKFEIFPKNGANTVNLPLQYRLKTLNFFRSWMKKWTSSVRHAKFSCPGEFR